MAGIMNIELDTTHMLPVELLQKVFWFSKCLEPPVYPGTMASEHEFKSSWSWPIHADSNLFGTASDRHKYRLGWVRITHVSHRWREAALTDKRLWASASEVALLPTSWSSTFLERSGVLPLHVSLSSMRYFGSGAYRLRVKDVVEPWFTREAQGRIRSLAVRLVIDRISSPEDVYFDSIVADLGAHTPMLESLILQADARYHTYRVLPSDALLGAGNLRRLHLAQFVPSQFDAIPFSQITHLRLEVNRRTVLPGNVRMSGNDLQNMILALKNIQVLELLGTLPDSPIVDPISLAPSCRYVELGVNGPLMHICSTLLSSLIMPAQTITSIVLDGSWGHFGLGYTAIPGILERFFGKSNPSAVMRLSITNLVVEIAIHRITENIEHPSPLNASSISPHLSVKLVEPHNSTVDALFAALRRACISGAETLRLECDQVAISIQMLQRLFDETTAPGSIPLLTSPSANHVRTLSLGMHTELYLRKSPLWNIFDALAQKAVGDRPLFPALQTLVVSGLPHHTRWLAVENPSSGLSSENVHYIPPALITCLKARRDLGYPVASVQVPFKSHNTDIQDGLEGLVYLEYF